ncbi:uracil-DNA glycosylase [Shewanella sp. NIFS-20-20]|uniref:uracil-DNA glycosylase n=1 Tax=Shewanella sp. NIFS-20-20 TaxID=2853806 RepID=UPI001C4889CC|nr:uracil-DNA glycosylase [Shewanella sp. NIFS-20-20]MBV7315814.1 uracil-DNA glycosylase [Shewanella sp. NIFS-20-20]
MSNYTHWSTFIAAEQQQAYFKTLEQFVAVERQTKTIFPPANDVYRAFELTPLDQVRVVILGQDPYHGPGQAHGLCFSVKLGVKTPPSLVNMYKELATDIADFTIPGHGFLEGWARQGVLMLNTVLTVEQGKAHSHANAGWETFTGEVMTLLNQQPHAIIFVLWGSHAIKKGKVITAAHHQVLTGPHPSPLSAYRGFFGCRHFSTINQLLQAGGQSVIDWQV